MTLFLKGSASCENFEDQVRFDLVRSFRWGCPKDYHISKCAKNRIKQIQTWLKTNDIHQVLVTGKMGSGKTTFVRGLTENIVLSLDPLLPHTREVTAYEGCHESSCFVMYDTPGLKDNENSSNDYDYLTQMVKMKGEPDLLIYAVKMDDYVIQEDDVEAIRSITNAFGWRVWKKAMFILTFANMVEKVGQPSNSVANKIFFSETKDKHHEDIVNALSHQKVERDVIDSIVSVPVGIISEPSLPAQSQGGSWIDIFWKEADKILLKPKKTYDKPKKNGSSLSLKSPSILIFVWPFYCIIYF